MTQKEVGVTGFALREYKTQLASFKLKSGRDIGHEPSLPVIMYNYRAGSSTEAGLDHIRLPAVCSKPGTIISILLNQANQFRRNIQAFTGQFCIRRSFLTLLGEVMRQRLPPQLP